MPVKSKGDGFMAPTNGTPGYVDMESNNPSVSVTSELGGPPTIKECRLSVWQHPINECVKEMFSKQNLLFISM